MNKLIKVITILFILGMSTTGCENPVIDETTGGDVEPTDANVILHFTTAEQEMSTTRAAKNITEICSRLNIAVFNNEGTKVSTVAQKAGDNDYGTVALNLSVGTYKLVVMAHNCDGAATISAMDKVTFPNNKVTDTFYYYGDLAVTTEKKSYDLTLTRAVAMFRLIMTDEAIPAKVKKLKFYYLGGSSTFSPMEGIGNVNSKQTEIRDVNENGVYEIYTLPHSEESTLTKLTITALDANDAVVRERIFEDVPIVRNQVTQYSGTFFDGDGNAETGSSNIRMTADPEWNAVKAFSF